MTVLGIDERSNQFVGTCTATYPGIAGPVQDPDKRVYVISLSADVLSVTYSLSRICIALPLKRRLYLPIGKLFLYSFAQTVLFPKTRISTNQLLSKSDNHNSNVLCKTVVDNSNIHCQLLIYIARYHPPTATKSISPSLSTSVESIL